MGKELYCLVACAGTFIAFFGYIKVVFVDRCMLTDGGYSTAGGSEWPHHSLLQRTKRSLPVVICVLLFMNCFILMLLGIDNSLDAQKEATVSTGWTSSA
jgi:hypothetical protein